MHKNASAVYEVYKLAGFEKDAIGPASPAARSQWIGGMAANREARLGRQAPGSVAHQALAERTHRTLGTGGNVGSNMSDMIHNAPTKGFQGSKIELAARATSGARNEAGAALRSGSYVNRLSSAVGEAAPSVTQRGVDLLRKVVR